MILAKEETSDSPPANSLLIGTSAHFWPALLLDGLLLAFFLIRFRFLLIFPFLPLSLSTAFNEQNALIAKIEMLKKKSYNFQQV